jgi:hypothetical protein
MCVRAEAVNGSGAAHLAIAHVIKYMYPMSLGAVLFHVYPSGPSRASTSAAVAGSRVPVAGRATDLWNASSAVRAVRVCGGALTQKQYVYMRVIHSFRSLRSPIVLCTASPQHRCTVLGNTARHTQAPPHHSTAAPCLATQPATHKQLQKQLATSLSSAETGRPPCCLHACALRKH